MWPILIEHLEISSQTLADFIYVDNKDLTITTNKVASTLDLNTIKNISRMWTLLIWIMLEHQGYLSQNHT